MMTEGVLGEIMKSIYIATFCDWDNYGSILQSIALKRTLFKIGVSSTIIEAKEELKNKYEAKKPRKDIRSLLDFLYNMVFCKSISLRFVKNTRVIKDELDIMYLPDYLKQMFELPKGSIYLSGSDQVWSPLLCHRLFFLDFPTNNIKISYAASLGVSYIPKEKENEFMRLVNNFDYISVRERDAVQLINKLTDKPVYQHLDPVFLLKRVEWSKLEEEYEIDEPYILVYAIYWARKYNKQLRELHKVSGKKIVVIENGLQWIYGNKRIRDGGVMNFLSLIRNADAVISSSFHGVAISIVYNKKVAAVINPQSPSRISNLLDELNYINPSIPEVLDIQNNYIQINKIIAAETKKSYTYLTNILI